MFFNVFIYFIVRKLSRRYGGQIRSSKDTHDRSIPGVEVNVKSSVYVHPCSKVMGSFFAVAKYGVYFQGIGLKFCVWHKEVFCIHNEKYLKCMIYRHVWVNIQIW